MQSNQNISNLFQPLKIFKKIKINQNVNLRRWRWRRRSKRQIISWRNIFSKNKFGVMETGFQLEHWSTAGHWLVGQAPRLLFSFLWLGGRPFSSLLYIYTSPCRYHGNMVGGGKPPPTNHQDLFFWERVYRCVHTRIYLNFNQPRKRNFLFFWLSVLFFIYTFVRFIKCPPTHLGWLTPRPLSLRYTHPPFFWNRIGNLSTFITEKESSKNVDLVSKNFKFKKTTPPSGTIIRLDAHQPA